VGVEESVRFANTQPNDDEAVVRMGHPEVVAAIYWCLLKLYGIRWVSTPVIFERFRPVLTGVWGVLHRCGGLTGFGTRAELVPFNRPIALGFSQSLSRVYVPGLQLSGTFRSVT
jgi:hypothetical protein